MTTRNGQQLILRRLTLPRTRDFAGVHSQPQFLSGLEERNRFLVDGNRGSRPWVAPGASVAVLDGEGTETTQLHPLTTGEGEGDLLENRGDDGFHILPT